MRPQVREGDGNPANGYGKRCPAVSLGREGRGERVTTSDLLTRANAGGSRGQAPQWKDAALRCVWRPATRRLPVTIPECGGKVTNRQSPAIVLLGCYSTYLLALGTREC